PREGFCGAPRQNRQELPVDGPPEYGDGGQRQRAPRQRRVAEEPDARHQHEDAEDWKERRLDQDDRHEAEHRPEPLARRGRQETDREEKDDRGRGLTSHAVDRPKRLVDQGEEGEKGAETALRLGRVTRKPPGMNIEQDQRGKVGQGVLDLEEDEGSPWSQPP